MCRFFRLNIRFFFTNAQIGLLNFVPMLRYLAIALLVYFLYNFLFHFLLPVGKAAREMKKKVDAFQDQMQQADRSQQQEPQTATRPQPKAGDYIDFEEVKER